MFHAVGQVKTRGRSSGIGRNYPNSIGEGDWKAPLRCGILFCTLSCILIVIGVILTWLGTRSRSVHDVFGESVPITGPILLSVGGLMSLLALRQFYLAHVHKKLDKVAQAKTEKQKEALNAEEDAANQTNDEDLEKGGHGDDGVSDGLLNKHGCSAKGMLGYDPSNHPSSMWPPMSTHNPYYSMAMMVYKDPALTFGPYLASHSQADYGATTSAGASSTTSPSQALPCTSTSSYPDTSQTDLPSTSSAEPGEAISPTDITPIPQAINSEDSAVLEATSTTLPNYNRPALTHTVSAPVSSVVYSSYGYDPNRGPESPRIFPSDYLNAHHAQGSSVVSANAGIHNLPKPTAFMMLRTLEIQETI